MAAVAHPSRPQIRRNSPLSAHPYNTGFTANAPTTNRFGLDDSDSDDEPPPAIRFSKVTQALLADAGPVPSSPPRKEESNAQPRFNRSVSTNNRPGLDTPSRAPGLKIVRKSSPSVPEHGRGYTPPRIVQVGSAKGSGPRSISISGPYPQRFAVKRDRDPTPEPLAPGKQELVTPAPAPRALRVTRARTGSNASQDGQAHHPPSSLSRPGSRNGSTSRTASQEQNRYASDLGHGASISHAPETVTRYGNSTIGRSRNTSADAAAVPPGSQRVKRAPLATGSFLKSMPARRFKRRGSEDNVSPADDVPAGSASQPSTSAYTPQERSFSGAEGPRSRSGSINTRATSVEPISVHDFANKSHASQSRGRESLSRSQMSGGGGSRAPSRHTSRDGLGSRQPSMERYQQRSRRPSIQTSDAPASSGLENQRPQPQRQPSVEPQPRKPTLAEHKPPQRAPSLSRAQYRYVAPAKIHTDVSEDQENMPPPTFKRNKDQEFKILGQHRPHIAVLSDDEKPSKPSTHSVHARMVDETPVPVPAQQQQERKALGQISGNTPHRPAPAPPPKMSVLETATATAGASVTKSKKKRSHIVVNGKIFTQMGRIGKGGTSDVYCVMAENYKTFALKRVKLEDCDESAVRGYKGEIDLLKKLTEVERVVRLFDWELNEQKQELCVLMEKGEADLNRVLTLRLSAPESKWDATFTRFYWREMLECVAAVHEHEIVHSDLKPANFLVVSGRLKLIDFGIANAIETDHTVNVHRDCHVGTPNYMSPESITDTNTSSPGGASSSRDAAGRPLKKDMKIGKASDVWSLGCILYQMTYGRPPFAHIPNQISRIMAITNPHHAISFPETGINNTPIPPTLRGTLRKCLNRDPEKRPTVHQLLGDGDPFLNPDPGKDGVVITVDLLGQIIEKVVERCRDAGGRKGFPGEAEVGQWPASFVGKIREMQAGG